MGLLRPSSSPLLYMQGDGFRIIYTCSLRLPLTIYAVMAAAALLALSGIKIAFLVIRHSAPIKGMFYFSCTLDRHLVNPCGAHGGFGMRVSFQN